jgi:hypothetical protein
VEGREQRWKRIGWRSWSSLIQQSLGSQFDVARLLQDSKQRTRNTHGFDDGSYGRIYRAVGRDRSCSYLAVSISRYRLWRVGACPDEVDRGVGRGDCRSWERG